MVEILKSLIDLNARTRYSFPCAVGGSFSQQFTNWDDWFYSSKHL